MAVPVSHAAPPAAASGTPAQGRSLPRLLHDPHSWIAVALYLVVSLVYQHAQVSHLGSACNCGDTDPTQWMWSWNWLPHALLNGENPLITNQIWYPLHFDLAANTLAPLSAIPGAPLSALFGPIAAYNLLSITAPVINGWAAYRLCRYVSGAPWASIVAGYTFGFSTYELGHLLGHVHLIFVFALPLLVLAVLRYVDGAISRRRAIVTAALLVIIEFGLSSELVLDMTYLGAVALLAASIWAPAHRVALIRAIGVLAVAYALTAVAWSYYIYAELTGPEGTKGFGAQYPADLLSYVFPTDMFALGGQRFLALSSRFMTGAAPEQNSYLGLPLCALLGAFVVGQWRRPVTKVIGTATCVAFLLSLGTQLTIAGHPTISMPFDILERLPFFDLSLPSRLGLFVALGAALATALWLAWARAGGQRVRRWLVALAAVAFLVPDLAVADKTETYTQPRFFTSDLYQRYLTRNEVVMTLPNVAVGDEMLWQADTGMYFKLVGGYFGYPPPGYGGSLPGFKLLYQLSSNQLQPTAVYASELRAFLPAHHVAAVLVEDATSGPWTTGSWPEALAAAGWHRIADTGGIQVFRPNR